MKKYKPFLFFVIMASLVFTVGCKKNPSPAPLPPTITNINPSSGIAGATVTITGTNFSTIAANNTVKFNGTATSVTSATATSLVVTAPAAGTTGVVSVSTASGNANGPVFTYLLAPTITSINPTFGIAGASVTITGKNFDPVAANNTVKFNGTAAVVASATATSLVVTAPASGSTGTVTVATSGGNATGPVFTYLPAPTITSINPTSGAAGISVTITGTNFDPVAANNTVKFNGVAATVITASTTQLVVTVPATGTTGNITVTTAGGTSNGILFTYITLPTHDVYVLGRTASGGYCYWKNGVKTDMPSDVQGVNASVSSICASGTDVYVAGVNNNLAGAYWKNGTATLLQYDQGGYVHSIAVSGTDVYTCGETMNTNMPYAAYWKNGTYNAVTYSPYPINPGVNMGNGRAFGLALSGTNVYVAGHQSIQENNLYASYWLNGTPNLLRNTSSSSANAIFINGADIYFALNDINTTASYSKNGTYVNLSPQPSGGGIDYGRLIYVTTANDVYVVGQSNGSAKYWKNGTMGGIISAQENDGSKVTCVHGVGNDVYMGGLYDGINNIWGYWVNGTFITLPNCNYVYDIFVQ